MWTRTPCSQLTNSLSPSISSSASGHPSSPSLLLITHRKKHLPLPPGLPAPLLALCQQSHLPSPQPTHPPARRESFKEVTPSKSKEHHSERDNESHHVLSSPSLPLLTPLFPQSESVSAKPYQPTEVSSSLVDTLLTPRSPHPPEA